MPNKIIQLIGPKYVSILKTWVPTMAGWGVVGGVAVVHFTDWRLILDYVPYINGKFKTDD
ncbi:cytochrome b-c1 complex subunit 10-like [Anguilla rostrata]|nr:cytochrome b-c1 complex subunit 10-like [Anguilla anguilla]